MAYRSKSGPEEPDPPFGDEEEEEEREWTEVDELDLVVGQTLRTWFELYEKHLIGYMSVGSYDKTGELTIMLRPIGEDIKFCTAGKYDDVARLFIENLNKIQSDLKEKLK